MTAHGTIGIRHVEARHAATATSAAGADPVVWSSPESKLWVGTRGGEYAGFIEFTDGHYAAADALGREQPARATLAEAKGLFGHDRTGGSGALRRAPVLAALAVGAGGVALSWLAVAIGVLHL